MRDRFVELVDVLSARVASVAHWLMLAVVLIGAFNALLKTLEEPPDHVVFIFATTEPQKIPDTILSRVQRFDFKRIPMPTVVARLQEIVSAEDIEERRKGVQQRGRRQSG